MNLKNGSYPIIIHMSTALESITNCINTLMVILLHIVTKTVTSIFSCISVFEIKHLFCAHIGCRGTHNPAPGDIYVCTGIYNVLKYSEIRCTHRVHMLYNVCTRQTNCAHRVQDAPLISNTDYIYILNNNVLRLEDQVNS